MILSLRAIFNRKIGVSDHSRSPVLVPSIAASLKAYAVEKHITLSAEGGGLDIFHPVSLGIFFGLIVGKVVGICTACWIVVKTGLAEMPKTLVPGHFFGASLLAGIGFTMSIFITTLAWDASSQFIIDAKFSILAASIVSGILGFLVLRSCPLSGKCDK